MCVLCKPEVTEIFSASINYLCTFTRADLMRNASAYPCSEVRCLQRRSCREHCKGLQNAGNFYQQDGRIANERVVLVIPVSDPASYVSLPVGSLVCPCVKRRFKS